MSQHSVETNPPPTQATATAEAPRAVIRSWPGGMRLEDAGDGAATIVRRTGDDRTILGDITYSTATGEHTIAWNQDGKAAYTSAQRDSWDDAFYDAMEWWQRSRS